MPFTAGDVVVARGDRWIVEEATHFDDCTLLRLAGAGIHNRDSLCRLLQPFDKPVIAGAPRIRVVGRRRWIHHLDARLADTRTLDQLRAARAAVMDILPFQLEPALALIQGKGSRFLLADEVGLGKTIQAGLMLAELQRRGLAERALILTPAGLRTQWLGELKRRFDIHATVFDASTIRTLASAVPFDVNPWTVEPVVLNSIDFIKQPEVHRGAASVVWDILIVDEAHQLAQGSLRAEAAGALARQARYVVLLTATPHAGDDAAYRSLCSLGQIGDADGIVLFRRTREQAGLTRARHAHLLQVRPTVDEIEMHVRLSAYSRELWQLSRNGRADALLVAMVLGKRAYSSAASLALSLTRRLEALTGPPAPGQPSLPFEAEDDGEALMSVPAFEELPHEERALTDLLAAARRASRTESKTNALLRLLRRVTEPVIVFTEYRDTLITLRDAIGVRRRPSMLHGGLTPAERRSAVEAFTSGDADLLLATDAGSEGLNLHGRCRLIINLELPWNPIRLEQRIGRVDRIGQTRTVHVINLLARDTAESAVLARLVRRIHRIRTSEIDMAAVIIGDAEFDVPPAEPSLERSSVSAGAGPDAEKEAARLRVARLRIDAVTRCDRTLIPVSLLRSRALPVRAPAIIWFVQSRIINSAGQVIEDALIPVALPSPVLSMSTRRRDIRAHAETLVAHFWPAIAAFVKERSAACSAETAQRSAGWALRTRTREHEINRLVSTQLGREAQPGLFDGRSTREREAAEKRNRSIGAESDARIRLVAASAAAAATSSAELALLLIAC